MKSHLKEYLHLVQALLIYRTKDIHLYYCVLFAFSFGRMRHGVSWSWGCLRRNWKQSLNSSGTSCIAASADCPGANWCPDAGLGGDPPRHHLLSHQKHARTMEAVLTGMWRPHTISSPIVSCLEESHRSWISLLAQFFLTLILYPWSIPRWVNSFSFHCLSHSVPNKVHYGINKDNLKECLIQ